MLNSRRLVLAHFWFAFVGFGGALLLGAWQMFVRSPLHAWIGDPELYYRSVTAHGTTMGYVFPTLIAMGYGYLVTELSLKPTADRAALGLGWPALVAVGTMMAFVPVAMGLASVLYTFYPPMIGNPFYYIGVVLVVVGSWIWVGLMSVNLTSGSDKTRGARAVPNVRHGRRLPISGVGRRSAPRSNCCSRSSRWRSASQDDRRRASRACCSRGRCTQSCTSG